MEGRLQFCGLRISSLLLLLVLMASSVCDLQHSLDQCTAKCKAAGMKLRTSNSETVVLNRKTGGLSTPRREWVLTASEGVQVFHRLVHEWGDYVAGDWFRGNGFAFALPHCCDKRELGRNAKLSIYRSAFVPYLTRGHEEWVMTERMRLWIQTAEMGFLRRVAGISLRDKVRSSVIRDGIGVPVTHTNVICC